jgi:hypothetical protein
MLDTAKRRVIARLYNINQSHLIPAPRTFRAPRLLHAP